MSNNIITQINLSQNEELIQYKRKKQIRPNYYMVGNGTMNKHKIESIDLIEAVMNCSKAEQLVIKTIKDKVSYENSTGEVYISLSREFDKTNTSVFQRGFKKLKDKDLVRRTKTSHYMINPNALVPTDYTKSLLLWKESKGN